MGEIYDKFNERIVGVDFTVEEQLKTVNDSLLSNSW